jgi:murein DD-endopeptidase MepM/ murein hydrolase activator NlpD
VYCSAVICSSSSVPRGASAEEEIYEIPENLCSPFRSYPNPLGLTEQDRKAFHPVVEFPMVWIDKEEGPQRRVKVPNVVVADNSGTSLPDQVQLATEEQIEQRKREIENTRWFERLMESTTKKEDQNVYSVGRYDENRVGMYVSEMFGDQENSIDGYAGARTLHMGIDLGGPVGTKVHAFTDGTIHSIGYNPNHGDYGNVVVVEHVVPPPNDRKVWALYGHLDGKTIQGKEAGQKVRKGQVLGRLGDIHENGGW